MSATRVTLYGGVNEIGGNKFLVEEGEDAILLDFGTSIGARGQFYEEFLQPRTNAVLRDLLRLDLLPRLDGVYRDDLLAVARAATDRDLPESAAAWRARNGGRNRVAAVLLTHAHVDHFQDLAFLDPAIPVYCTPTTRRMLEAIEAVSGASVDAEVVRTRRRGVGESGAGATFGARAKVDTAPPTPRDIREIEDLETLDVGGFRVTAVPTDHSVPGACAFAIVTPRGKRLFYTGDVRFHGRLDERTSHLLKVAASFEPDAMLCEGTRIDSPHSDNERDVERGVHALAAEAKGLVVAEFGWKDTTRFDTIQRVAAATGRTLLVDPRLALLLKRLDGRPDVPSRAIESYGNVRAYLRRRDSMLDEPGDYEKHEAGYLTDWGKASAEMKRAWKDRDEAVLAEGLAHYRNAARARDVLEAPDRYIVHLSFWSASELFDLDPPAGSQWIRCATEPYGPEMAMDLARQRRWLEHFGMDHNVNPTKGHDPGLLRGTTHVSGHGARPDLERLVRAASPRTLIPVHTSESSLDRFEELGFDTRLFRGAGFSRAARGACVVEL